MISITKTISTRVITTTPFLDQKPGTSGLRKKTQVVKQEHYLQNFIQSLLSSLRADELSGYNVLVAGGDGRYFNREALESVIEMGCANGVDEVHVAKGGLMSTPAVSAYIRKINSTQGNCIGGMVLTASHNPGGPDQDWGIKYNVRNGGPAPEEFTNRAYEISKTIQQYRRCEGMAQLIDLDQEAEYRFENVERPQKSLFIVKVIDGLRDYVEMIQKNFNFQRIKQLTSRADFSMVFDGMNGIAGPYAQEIFINQLGVPQEWLINCSVKEDFGGLHPDPNLTYAKQLATDMDIKKQKERSKVPVFGAACDGDADRNMILGRQFFVTPSDSLAVLVANHQVFMKDMRGVARSMPTSGAVDQVAKKMDLPLYETPTGWKYFGNLMDAHRISICGEESFGTGSTHIREKDGLWAIMAWLAVLSEINIPGEPLVEVDEVVLRHWKEYGRNYYCRFDYENIETKQAQQVMDHLRTQFDWWSTHRHGSADQFDYVDPIDGSVSKDQGLRFIYTDGSRVVFRLSGTGSQGATLRIYFEKYEKHKVEMDQQEALKEVIKDALQLGRINELTGRGEPSVMT